MFSLKHLSILSFVFYLQLTYVYGQNVVSWINAIPNPATIGFSSNIIVSGPDDALIFLGDAGDNNNNVMFTITPPSGPNRVLLAGDSDIAFIGETITFEAISYLGNNVCSVVSGQDDIYIEQGVSASYTGVNCVINSSLPINYETPLNAKIINKQTQIKWSVATQLNNDKYIIEHSNPESFRDGRNFSSIGEIAGDGTSNETKHYEYIHTSPYIGINYYRIKQVDYDGKYSYSDVASVRYDGTGETNIYPNPATSEVTISTTESTSLQIIDIYGRVLSKQDISEGQNTIILSSLPTGILIFVYGDQRYKVLKE